MAFTLGDAVVFFGGDTTELDKGIDSSQGKLGSFGSKASAVLGGVLVAGAAAATTAIAALGAAAFDVSKDTETAARKLEAQLGTSRQEAERLAEAARGVFGQNFAESVTEAGEAVGLLVKHIDDVAGREEDLTAKAFAISDAFGPSVEEVISAVSTLTKEFDDLDPEQAFDLVAAGFQRGLNKSDDFLDSIGEYSNLFSDAKFTAAEFFSTLETGQAGGVLGTDKIADAVKEFNVRMLEGSDDVADAMDSIGLNSAKAFAGISDGSLSVKDVFEDVLDALWEIEDPIERNRAAIELLGTQAEDLGVDFMEGLNTAEVSLDDMAGAAEDLNAQYDTLGGAMGAIWRELIVELSPLTDLLLDLANASIPTVRKAAGFLGRVIKLSVTTGVQNLSLWMTNLKEKMSPLKEAFDTLVEGIKPFAEKYGPVFVAVLGAAWSVLSWLVDTAVTRIRDTITLLIQLLSGDFEGAWETAKGIVQNQIDTWTGLITGAVDIAKAAFEDVDWEAVGKQVIDGIKKGTDSARLLFLVAWSRLSRLVKEIWGWIDWQAVGQRLIDGIKAGAESAAIFLMLGLFRLIGWVKGAWEAVDWAAVGKTVLTSIRDGAETAIETASEALSGIADWVGGWFSGIDWIAEGTALLDAAKGGLETALATASAVVSGIAGWVGGWFGGIDWVAGGSALLGLVLGGIDSAVQTAVAGVKGIAGWVGGWFGGIDWAGEGTSLLDAAKGGLETALATASAVVSGIAAWVGGWFGGIDWVAGGSALLGLVLGGIDSAVQTAVAAVKGIAGWVGGWFGGIDWAGEGTSLLDAAKGGLETALATASSALSGIAAWVGGWFGGIDWAAGGKTLLGLVLGGIDSAVQTAVAAVKGIAGWVGGWFGGIDWAAEGTSLLASAKSGLETALATASSALSGIAAWVGGWFGGIDWAGGGKTLLDLVLGGLDTSLQSGTSVLTGISAWVAGWFSGIDWAATGRNILNALVTGLTTVFTARNDAVEGLTEQVEAVDGRAVGLKIGQTIVDGIKSLFLPGEGEGGADWSALGAAILDGILGGILLFWDIFVLSMDVFIGIVQSIWTGFDWASIGQAILDGIEAGLATAWLAFVEWLTGEDGVLTKMKAEWDDFDWAAIGGSIIDGIRTGIENAKDRLLAKVREVASSVLDAGKGFLGIDSPSRAAAEEIGRPFAQGVAVGIEAEGVGIRTALLDALSEAFGHIGGPAAAQASAGVNTINLVQNFGGPPDSPASIGRASGNGLLDALHRTGER